jgi:hypothetical protein
MKTQTSDELWAATGEMLKQIHGLETVDVGMFDAVLRNPQENVTAPSARRAIRFVGATDSGGSRGGASQPRDLLGT